jgi:DNA processing protein
MPPDQELLSWIKLGLVAELSAAPFRKLLAEFGSPEAICSATHSALRHLVTAEVASALERGPDPARVEATLRWLEDSSNRVITLADEAYPRLLLETSDPPALLYLKGNPDLLNRNALAVVGSRNATQQGIANAEAFAHELSDGGFTIVSGLALGIDAAAHRGGLAGAGSSIAVVGTGLDIVYPARNRDLAHRLAEEGALVSEFALGMPALASNFPRRNRLLSGMARGCLIVEAALKSGSLITARYALEQGREVFAVPGSIHSSLSKGCHLLIKQGAKLVESAADILEEFGVRTAPAKAVGNIRSGNPDLDTVLEALGFDPVALEKLCERCGLTPESASAMLLQLELDGFVNRLPGGKFQRLR